MKIFVNLKDIIKAVFGIVDYADKKAENLEEGVNSWIERKIHERRKRKLAKLEKEYTEMKRDFNAKFEKEFGVKLKGGDTFDELLEYGEKRFGGNDDEEQNEAEDD